MVHRVLDRLANVAHGRPLWDRIGELFGDRVRTASPSGQRVEFCPTADELDAVTRNCDLTLRSVTDRLEGSGHRGLFIVLDDIHGLASSPTFSTWLKGVVDTVAVSWKPFPVLFLFVGTEPVRRELVSHNWSVARIFTLLHVTGWSHEETSDFYRRAFGRVGMTVEDEALQLMTERAGGQPALAHQIGDTAYRHASGALVGKDDARRAVISAARGARARAPRKARVRG